MVAGFVLLDDARESTLEIQKLFKKKVSDMAHVKHEKLGLNVSNAENDGNKVSTYYGRGGTLADMG